MTVSVNRLAPAAVLFTAAALTASCGAAGGAAPATSSSSATSVSESTVADATFPMVLDNCGVELVVEKQPEKVLTIGADPLAQMAAAGAGDKVVGYSALLGVELPSLPGVTAPEVTSEDPSTEQVLSSGADFVIANAFYNTDPAILKENGITSWVPSSVCDHLVSSSSEKVEGTVSDKPILQKIQDDLRTMGQLFGTGEASSRAAEDLAARVDAVKAKNVGQGRSVAIVYYFDENSAIGGIGGGGVPNEFVSSLGLRNVFGDQKETWLQGLSWETLLQQDPEVVVFITNMTPGMDLAKSKERFLAEQGAGQLRAVSNDSFFHLEYHQGIAAPVSIDGLESLAGQLEK